MQKLPGVANVDIDADARTAIVSVEAGAFSAADAVEALKSRGFPADTVKALEVASVDGTEAQAAEPEDAVEDAEGPADSTEAPAKDAEAPAESIDAPAKEAKEE